MLVRRHFRLENNKIFRTGSYVYPTGRHIQWKKLISKSEVTNVRSNSEIFHTGRDDFRWTMSLPVEIRGPEVTLQRNFFTFFCARLCGHETFLLNVRNCFLLSGIGTQYFALISMTTR